MKAFMLASSITAKAASIGRCASSDTCYLELHGEEPNGPEEQAQQASVEYGKMNHVTSCE
tara:strand:- start:325 stop:504 length:180 start_codon:yes stop_codon:yes gene_type:complete